MVKKSISLILMSILLCGIIDARQRRKRNHYRTRRIIPVQIIKSWGNGRFNVERQGSEILDFLKTQKINYHIGQQAVHNAFGLEHLNAIDVGISPKSKQGQKLLQFLRCKQLPFLMISGRKQGVSTGPHFHIGFPSPRTYVSHPVGTTNGQFNSMRCPFYHNGSICF